MKNWKKTAHHVSTAMALSLSLPMTVAFAAEKIAIPLSGTAIISSVTNMQVSPSVLDMGDVSLNDSKSLIEMVSKFDLKDVSKSLPIVLGVFDRLGEE